MIPPLFHQNQGQTAEVGLGLESRITYLPFSGPMATSFAISSTDTSFSGATFAGGFTERVTA